MQFCLATWIVMGEAIVGHQRSVASSCPLTRVATVYAEAGIAFCVGQRLKLITPFTIVSVREFAATDCPAAVTNGGQEILSVPENGVASDVYSVSTTCVWAQHSPAVSRAIAVTWREGDIGAGERQTGTLRQSAEPARAAAWCWRVRRL